MRIGHLGLAVLWIAAYATESRAGECAPRILTPRIVTADKATLPSDGGIVVAEGESDGLSTATTGPIKGWRFVDGKKRVAPKQRVIAPGLTVLEPVGTHLINAKGSTIRTFTRSKTEGTLAAPTIKGVEQRSVIEGRRNFTYVNVLLADAVPTQRYLVALDKDGKVARSFGVANAGATLVQIYTAGECTVLPDKTQITQAGDSITLAWLDSTGTLSPRSAPVTVTSKGTDWVPMRTR